MVSGWLTSTVIPRTHSETMAEHARSATILERAVARGQQGRLSPEVVLWVLAAGNVVILDEGEIEPTSFPSSPLIVRRGEAPFLAVFTHEDFSQMYKAAGRVAVAVPAFEILRRLPGSVGLVINPGSALGLEVPPDGLQAFTASLLEAQIP